MEDHWIQCPARTTITINIIQLTESALLLHFHERSLKICAPSHKGTTGNALKSSGIVTANFLLYLFNIHSLAYF